MFNENFHDGFKLISSVAGNFNILFITLVFVVYSIKDWKKIMLLFLAFITGDVLNILIINFIFHSYPAKFLLYTPPVVMMLASLINISQKSESPARWQQVFRYVAIILFCFTSSQLLMKHNITGIKNTDIGADAALTLGFECGRLIVALIVCIVTTLLISVFNVKHREMNLVASGAGLGMAMFLLFGG